jgi:hypothetical protein
MAQTFLLLSVLHFPHPMLVSFLLVCYVIFRVCFFVFISLVSCTLLVYVVLFLSAGLDPSRRIDTIRISLSNELV